MENIARGPHPSCLLLGNTDNKQTGHFAKNNYKTIIKVITRWLRGRGSGGERAEERWLFLGETLFWWQRCICLGLVGVSASSRRGWPGAGRWQPSVGNCNMDICSGSCIQSGAMDFICLSYVNFALLDLISCPELFSDSGSQYYI